MKPPADEEWDRPAVPKMAERDWADPEEAEQKQVDPRAMERVALRFFLYCALVVLVSTVAYVLLSMLQQHLVLAKLGPQPKFGDAHYETAANLEYQLRRRQIVRPFDLPDVLLYLTVILSFSALPVLGLFWLWKMMKRVRAERNQ